MSQPAPTHAEILYKLGQIETEIRTWNSTWGVAIKRIEDMISELATRVEKDNHQLEIRVTKLEADATIWKTRFYTALAFVTVGWAILGDTAHKFIDRVFGNG